MTQVEIPNRSLFRQPEVCALASIQPYVLRSWEAEFPDLGVARVAGGPRVYRRADVERVLRIKQLLYGEGLTLAGVRRKLTEEGASAPAADASEVNLNELMGEDARERILTVKRGLRELSVLLSRAPGTMRDEEFRLHVDEPAPRKAKAARPVAVKKKK